MSHERNNPPALAAEHTRSIDDDARVRMAPGTWDEESRTLDIVWSTGADVQRSDWLTGDRYIERLSMDPAHIRLDRLNAGAPLLDSHRSHGAANVVGSIVPGSVRVADGVGTATVRLTDAEDVASTVRKIIDGSLRSISVGYRTHGETRETVDGVEIRTATDWEPHEVSAVPVPADARAQTRTMERETPQETSKMQDLKPIETAPTVDADAIRAEAVEAERKRAADIREAAAALSLGDKADDFISRGVSADEARAALINMVAKADEETDVNNTIRVGKSHDEQARAGLTNALEHRVGVRNVDLTDAGRSFRGMTLAEMARESLVLNGVPGAARMSLRDAVTLAMAPQAARKLSTDWNGNVRAIGAHSTSDFPYLLANVANKFLLDGYETEALNFEAFVRDRAVPDFKQVSAVKVGEITSMSAKPEGSEYTYATVGEEREVYTLATYGKGVKLTREAVINDDLGGFQQVINQMGRAWAFTQLDLCWAIFTGNPAMGDGNNLFDSSNHSNVGTNGALALGTLAELKKLLRLQKGVPSTSGGSDGAQLNLMPGYLCVPAALEETALGLIAGDYAPTTAATAKNNWVRGLSLIVEPRLDAADANAYYLGAMNRPFIERGLLGGNANPYIDNMTDWDTDCVSYKVRGDVAFKAIDWRPITKNAGPS